MWSTGNGGPSHAPILISRAVVEQIESFKFLGVHITNKLSWSKHTKTVVKRAQQNLFPLRRLKRFGMGPQILKRFYSCTIESILTGCITAWCSNCSASDRKALEGSANGPVHQWGQAFCHPGPHTRRCQRKALKIVKASSHPSHRLFSLLVHSKRYRSCKSRSKRLLNIFDPQANS